jgi:hypothetical protein
VFACFGVVVGGESEKGMQWVGCEGGGVVWCISRYRKNGKKKNTHISFSFRFWRWWAQFLIVVASVNLPGAAWVIHSAGECVCGYFLSEFKVGRGRDLL